MELQAFEDFDIVDHEAPYRKPSRGPVWPISHLSVIQCVFQALVVECDVVGQDIWF